MPSVRDPAELVQANPTALVVPPPARNGPADRPRTAAEVAKALAAPFKVSQLGWKPQVVKDNRALAVPYIDARDVMNRLDQVLGPTNWRDAYKVLAGGCVVCRLSVRLDGEWVSKVDVGSPSEQPDDGHRMKAAFSDALKRAAIKFGVARYLSYLPPTWADYDPKTRQIVTPPALPMWALPEPPVAGLEGGAR
jgi:hypothetical protein